MRFVWAVVAFVVAAVMIGAGIAQRTIFAAPEAQSATVETSTDAPYTMIDGGVFTMVPGAQTLTISGDEGIFASYGRTADVEAWLSTSEYNRVFVGGDGTAQTELVEPARSAPAAGETDGEGDEASAAPGEPAGSDLWLDEFVEDGDTLTTPLQLPDTMSMLVASDAVSPAPSTITITWPADVSTPWAGPLIVGGGIVLLVGVLLYLLGIRHVRRSRGPRRKGLPMPPTEPIDLSVGSADKGVISSTPATRRRSLASGRRRLIALPALGLAGVLLAGCSSDAWPQFEATATPSPSASVIVPENQQDPAVTEAQAERILTRVSTTVADADAATDAALAAERLTGAALAARETNYTLRAAVADTPTLPPIPDEPVEITLPQAYNQWPRSFLSVVEGPESTVAPTILLMTQEDPWSDYKAQYVASLEASTNLPDLAAPYVGAALAPPESPFLLLRPDQLAAAYADLIDQGDASASWDLFDTAGDQLLAGIRNDRQARLDELNQTGAGTSEISFASEAGSAAPVALTTLDGGAIVALSVNEIDTVRPTNEDAVIRLENNPAVQALTGVDQSATGFTTTFGDQLFFYVPLKDTGERIRLLGYSTSLLDAKEIE